jgi:hypothetical protein
MFMKILFTEIIYYVHENPFSGKAIYVVQMCPFRPPFGLLKCHVQDSSDL